jgi:hypothetical protein
VFEKAKAISIRQKELSFCRTKSAAFMLHEMRRIRLVHDQ